MEEMPALYNHCCEVWQRMADKSEPQVIDDVDVLVYTGFLTKEFDSLRLAVPYYSSVMKALREMNCVTQIKRGGGSAPSDWLIEQQPTPELWRTKTGKGKNKTLKAKSHDQLLQMILALNNRLNVLEQKERVRELQSGDAGGSEEMSQVSESGRGDSKESRQAGVDDLHVHVQE